MRRPLRRSPLTDHGPRLPGGQLTGWSGRPRGVLFAIAGRTDAQRCYCARQRCGDPGPDPLGERPLGHAPRVPGSAISLLTCALAAVPSVTARRCPERLTARRPVLLAARMLARYKFLYSISRPACGRPPAALGRQPCLMGQIELRRRSRSDLLESDGGLRVIGTARSAAFRS